MTTTAYPGLEGLERYKFGWADSDVAGASARRGLSEAVVRDISAKKNEPEWMLDLRLKGLRLFGRKPLPDWGADLTGIDFGKPRILRSSSCMATSWRTIWSLPRLACTHNPDPHDSDDGEAEIAGTWSGRVRGAASNCSPGRLPAGEGESAGRLRQ
jgi:hypothetical protein